MNKSSRWDLRLLSLEDRTTPAVTAGLDELGNLVIQANEGGFGYNFTDVVAVADRTFQVFDTSFGSNVFVGEYLVSKDIVAKMNVGADTQINLDLGSSKGLPAFPGSLKVEFSNSTSGSNGATINNGSLGGVEIVAGVSANQSTIVFNQATVQNTTSIALNPQSSAFRFNTVIVNAGSTLRGNLTATGVDGGTIDGTVLGSVDWKGTPGSTNTVFGDFLTINGSVGRNLNVSFDGGIVNQSGKIGQSLNYGTLTADSVMANSLTVTGSINNSLNYTGTNFNDTIRIGTLASIRRNVVMNLLGGDDSVIFEGTVGSRGSYVLLSGGDGNDSVKLESTARFNSSILVAQLGAGDDTFTIADGARLPIFGFIDGSAGKDTFAGTRRPGLVVMNFEV
jgi:hypothetical protein